MAPSFSITSTDRPALPSRLASVAPVGPGPTIATSKTVGSFTLVLLHLPGDLGLPFGAAHELRQALRDRLGAREDLFGRFGYVHPLAHWLFAVPRRSDEALESIAFGVPAVDGGGAAERDRRHVLGAMLDQAAMLAPQRRDVRYAERNMVDGVEG